MPLDGAISVGMFEMASCSSPALSGSTDWSVGLASATASEQMRPPIERPPSKSFVSATSNGAAASRTVCNNTGGRSGALRPALRYAKSSRRHRIGAIAASIASSDECVLAEPAPGNSNSCVTTAAECAGLRRDPRWGHPAGRGAPVRGEHRRSRHRRRHLVDSHGPALADHRPAFAPRHGGGDRDSYRARRRSVMRQMPSFSRPSRVRGRGFGEGWRRSMNPPLRSTP